MYGHLTNSNFRKRFGCSSHRVANIGLTDARQSLKLMVSQMLCGKE